MALDDVTLAKINGSEIASMKFNGSEIWPPQYNKVNYLESTGTQYINTLYPAVLNTKIEIKFQYTSSTGDNKTRVFGSRYDWNKRAFYCGTNMNRFNEKWWFLVGTIRNDSYRSSNKNADRDAHILTLTKNGAVMDGVNIWTPTLVPYEFDAYATVGLFGAYEGNGQSTPTFEYGICRIYYCKIYENDVLVKDIVPVLDENDVPCMYEKISKTYLYNQGTGTFLYG